MSSSHSHSSSCRRAPSLRATNPAHRRPRQAGSAGEAQSSRRVRRARDWASSPSLRLDFSAASRCHRRNSRRCFRRPPWKPTIASALAPVPLWPTRRLPSSSYTSEPDGLLLRTRQACRPPSGRPRRRRLSLHPDRRHSAHSSAQSRVSLACWLRGKARRRERERERKNVGAPSSAQSARRLPSHDIMLGDNREGLPLTTMTPRLQVCVSRSHHGDPLLFPWLDNRWTGKALAGRLPKASLFTPVVLMSRPVLLVFRSR